MLQTESRATEHLVGNHHANCKMCFALFAYARAKRDAGILRAWYAQLSEHVTNDLLLRALATVRWSSVAK